jgi:regulator of protease activity HflC (stomatin/prohibitin superfamily)
MASLVAVAVVLAAVAVGVVLRAWHRVVVFEYERGLEYRGGRFSRVLEPGAYRHWVHRTTVVKVDVRPRVVAVAGQEVLTADGVPLRLSLAASFRVADPATAHNRVSSFNDALYLLLQLEIRRIVGASPIEEVLARRTGFGSALLAACAEPARALGLELEVVDVKDLILPGELKRIFAKVVEARQEGLAALERARGETAALRNLANAARLLDGSPALAQLRLLQHLATTSGNTYVLGVPTAAVPLPGVAQPPAGGPR